MEWLDSRAPTPPRIMMWINKNFHRLLKWNSFSFMSNDTVTLKGYFIVKKKNKTKPTLTIQSTKCSTWYVSKGFENMCLHKNLHRDV